MHFHSQSHLRRTCKARVLKHLGVAFDRSGTLETTVVLHVGDARLVELVDLPWVDAHDHLALLRERLDRTWSWSPGGVGHCVGLPVSASARVHERVRAGRVRRERKGRQEQRRQDSVPTRALR